MNKFLPLAYQIRRKPAGSGRVAGAGGERVQARQRNPAALRQRATVVKNRLSLVQHNSKHPTLEHVFEMRIAADQAG